MKNIEIYLRNQVLCKLIVALSLSVLLIGCNKVDNISGKWYSPNFGVMIISNDFIKYFRNNIPNEIWPKVEGKNNFRYQGINYTRCKLKQNSDLFVSVKKINSQMIQLIPSDSCFLKMPFTDNLILHRIPEKLKLNFDSISILQYIDGKFKEVRLTPKELKLITLDYKDFSIEERLWILFSSGVVNNSTADRFEATKIRLFGRGFYRERNILNVKVPKYVREIMNNDELD